MLKLLELTDSVAPSRARLSVAILHRIYGKFMAARSFSRRAFLHDFFRVIYECVTHNGVGRYSDPRKHHQWICSRA